MISQDKLVSSAPMKRGRGRERRPGSQSLSAQAQDRLRSEGRAEMALWDTARLLEATELGQEAASVGSGLLSSS